MNIRLFILGMLVGLGVATILSMRFILFVCIALLISLILDYDEFYLKEGFHNGK